MASRPFVLLKQFKMEPVKDLPPKLMITNLGGAKIVIIVIHNRIPTCTLNHGLQSRIDFPKRELFSRRLRYY